MTDLDFEPHTSSKQHLLHCFHEGVHRQNSTSGVFDFKNLRFFPTLKSGSFSGIRNWQKVLEVKTYLHIQTTTALNSSIKVLFDGFELADDYSMEQSRIFSLNTNPDGRYSQKMQIIFLIGRFSN